MDEKIAKPLADMILIKTRNQMIIFLEPQNEIGSK